MLAPSRFRFLNREDTLDGPEDWNDPRKPELWLYHLHYFHDLVARGADGRRDWHRDLIGRWIRENPPGEGVGWEPYPTSLRIVNWIKWGLRDQENVLPEPAVHSLAIQARWLKRRLECHLRGNHLLANAKALVFAGLFFEGDEARSWRRKGRELVGREIDEQILDDGGHFERSPMYHALVLEDLLDLVNVLRVYGRDVPPAWTRTAGSMRAWLEVMRHPDGEIPFFNDAAFGMALPPARLDRYAERLGVSPDARHRVRLSTHDLPNTGYVRMEAGPAVAFLDVAPVGPDHLPAHAHADTLSFELSLGDQRLFVNTGTSTYEVGNRRNRERGTPAHNTLAVDGEDSSEVWGGFRVARRARVTERTTQEGNGGGRARGTHDGYQRLDGEPMHSRDWTLHGDGMEIVDRIEGSGRHDVEVWLHLHPSWEVLGSSGPSTVIGKRDGPDGCKVEFSGPGDVTAVDSEFAPEFGRTEPTDALRYAVDGVRLPLEIRTRVSWSLDGETPA